MRIIKCLKKQMIDEICGAKEYAIDALEYRETNPELANLYHELSETEYKHALELHEHASKKIKEIQESGVKFPEFMTEKWEEAHNEMIKMAEEAKTYINLW